MRGLMTALLLILSFGAASAADAPWCYRDFGASRADCSYYSLRHCLARVGVLGAACERNHPTAKLRPSAKP